MWKRVRLPAELSSQDLAKLRGKLTMLEKHTDPIFSKVANYSSADLKQLHRALLTEKMEYCRSLDAASLRKVVREAQIGMNSQDSSEQVALRNCQLLEPAYLDSQLAVFTDQRKTLSSIRNQKAIRDLKRELQLKPGSVPRPRLKAVMRPP